MSERKRKLVEEEGWETIGTVHIVTMNHTDEGINEVISKVGVNEEPLFRPAELSQKVAGEMVRVQRKTDNSVVRGNGEGGVKFTKNLYKVIKEKEGGAPVSAPVGAPSKYEAPAPAPAEEKPSLLKNMIDNLQGQVNKIGDRIQSLNTHDKIIIGVACAALALAIAGFAIGLHLLH
jgi:hypothetical protein